VDGMMYERAWCRQGVSGRQSPRRVKVMAGLISREAPAADGRIRLRIAGRDIDLRVSSIPTAFGERIVLATA